MADARLCQPCPRGATCELGGASVVALPGYWAPIRAPAPVTSGRRRDVTSGLREEAGRRAPTTGRREAGRMGLKGQGAPAGGGGDNAVALYQCLPGAGG
jgi:hypothetical protein